jgi:hypothetical protein
LTIFTLREEDFRTMPDGVEIIRGGEGGARTGGTVGRETGRARRPAPPKKQGDPRGRPFDEHRLGSLGHREKRSPSGAGAKIGVPKCNLGTREKAQSRSEGEQGERRQWLGGP